MTGFLSLSQETRIRKKNHTRTREREKEANTEEKCEQRKIQCLTLWKLENQKKKNPRRPNRIFIDLPSAMKLVVKHGNKSIAIEGVQEDATAAVSFFLEMIRWRDERRRKNCQEET